MSLAQEPDASSVAIVSEPVSEPVSAPAETVQPAPVFVALDDSCTAVDSSGG